MNGFTIGVVVVARNEDREYFYLNKILRWVHCTEPKEVLITQTGSAPRLFEQNIESDLRRHHPDVLNAHPEVFFLPVVIPDFLELITATPSAA